MGPFSGIVDERAHVRTGRFPVPLPHPATDLLAGSAAHDPVDCHVTLAPQAVVALMEPSPGRPPRQGAVLRS
ncbi:hypothetical protein AB0K16_21835 [Nonomuraea jabiensis]|uniref:hypothetical protein n=1 Tax=Nonomuraea jabiensis TaxID=882448 RepID=UPI00342E352C